MNVWHVIYVMHIQRDVTHTGVLWCTYEYCLFSTLKSVESKIFRGLRPLDPRQGSAPAPRLGALSAVPLDPISKIRLALKKARYVRSAHMFAPNKKIVLEILRASYVRSAHMYCPKKIGIALRKLAMCATRTCSPPHNQSLPPIKAPHFLNPGAATAHKAKDKFDALRNCLSFNCSFDIYIVFVCCGLHDM